VVWNDNLAAIFEAKLKAAIVGMNGKIRRLKDICFRALNTCISSTRKKVKTFDQ
jgi:hypothetical protein